MTITDSKEIKIKQIEILVKSVHELYNQIDAFDTALIQSLSTIIDEFNGVSKTFAIMDQIVSDYDDLLESIVGENSNSIAYYVYEVLMSYTNNPMCIITNGKEFPITKDPQSMIDYLVTLVD
jgi:hypothetical protein